jgi:hypothetical protein
VESVEQDLLEQDTLLRQVRLRLGEAQNQMKQIYDKGHKDRVFQTGDMVYGPPTPIPSALCGKAHQHEVGS